MDFDKHINAHPIMMTLGLICMLFSDGKQILIRVVWTSRGETARFSAMAIVAASLKAVISFRLRFYA